MKFIEREHIDCEKWDRLVEDFGGLPFSKSFYLDAVAENWCVLVDKDYSSGIAIPYVVRLGKRSVYTPLFMRCLEWQGGLITQTHLDEIKRKFPKGEFNFAGHSAEQIETLPYQEIQIDSAPKYNDLAKRMIRKFESSNLSLVQVDVPKNVLEVIGEELPSKVTSVNQKSIILLENLVATLHANQLLRIIEVREEGYCVGGAFFIESRDRILYLKSAFRTESKKKGAMYKIMDLEIQRAVENNKTFDFGGSRVEGVRRFNLNLGAHDQFYSSMKWDEMPLWYKGIKILNDKLKKK
jgi:hypothetical protein